MDWFLQVILPVIIAGAVNLVLYYLQSKREKPKEESEIMENLADTSAAVVRLGLDLSKQLEVALKHAKLLRTGSKALEKQVEDLGYEPVFRANGLLEVSEDVHPVTVTKAKKRADKEDG